MGTKAEETSRRREAILKLVQQLDEADVAEIAGAVGASHATVRRDLASLEEVGSLVRTHGGARVVRPMSSLSRTMDERKRTMSQAKRAVAAAAVRLIDPGMTVALDVGSTVLFLVYELANRPPRRVITNSLLFMEALVQVPDLLVCGCSGELRRWNLDFVGYRTRECFEDWHPDIVFLTCTAYRPGKGLYKIDPDDAEIVRGMCSSVERTVLLMDHTKINGPGQIRALPVDAVDHIIVDDGISPDQFTLLQRDAATVETAPLEPEAERADRLDGEQTREDKE